MCWLLILGETMRNLGQDGPQRADADSLIAERELAIAALRTLCAYHSDDEWFTDEVYRYLGDIIDKHLALRLDARDGLDIFPG